MNELLIRYLILCAVGITYLMLNKIIHKIIIVNQILIKSILNLLNYA